MPLSNKVLKEIREQTAINDHGGAMLTAALALGCENTAKRIASINSDQQYIGHLSFSLKTDRDKAYVDLMAFAKKNLAPADYQKLYDAF